MRLRFRDACARCCFLRAAGDAERCDVLRCCCSAAGNDPEAAEARQ